jgi:hypothetical protein
VGFQPSVKASDARFIVADWTLLLTADR